MNPFDMGFICGAATVLAIGAFGTAVFLIGDWLSIKRSGSGWWAS